MEDGDLLVYADAGCTLNDNGKQRLAEYFEIVNSSPFGMLTFRLTHLEQVYTKRDLIQYLGAEEKHQTSGQILGTISFMRKCKHSVNVVQQWYNTCCHYHLIDDSPSISPNHASFVEHRHDQSVFSLVCKIYGTEVLPDETYYTNWLVDGEKMPIWATRKRY